MERGEKERCAGLSMMKQVAPGVSYFELIIVTPVSFLSRMAYTSLTIAYPSYWRVSRLLGPSFLKWKNMFIFQIGGGGAILNIKWTSFERTRSTYKFFVSLLNSYIWRREVLRRRHSSLPQTSSGSEGKIFPVAFGSPLASNFN